MKKKIREKDLQKQIKDYLTLQGYVVVKFASVGIYNPVRKQFIPQSRKGVADLLACSPKGRFFAIEVKVGYNKPTEEQLEFLQEINDRGGIGIVAYSLEDVENVIRTPN